MIMKTRINKCDIEKNIDAYCDYIDRIDNRDDLYLCIFTHSQREFVVRINDSFDIVHFAYVM